jgi:hypothetical protein
MTTVCLLGMVRSKAKAYDQLIADWLGGERKAIEVQRTPLAGRGGVTAARI